MDDAKKRVLHARMKAECPDLLKDFAGFGKLAAIHGETSQGTIINVGEPAPFRMLWDGKARPTLKMTYDGRMPLFDRLNHGGNLIGP